MKDYSFRALKIDDYDAVYALWKQTEGMGLGESDTHEAIAAFLERNCGLSLVACDLQGQIVGAVLCGHDGRRGYLHHLAVARRFRQRGIGRELVAACQAKLSQAGIQKCNIFIFASNASGRQFWTNNGWKLRTELRLMQIRLVADGHPRQDCPC